MQKNNQKHKKQHSHKNDRNDAYKAGCNEVYANVL